MIRFVKRNTARLLDVDIPEAIQNRWASISVEYKYGYALGMIAGLFAHGFLLCNMILNEDGTGQLTKNYFYWRSGRWLGDYYIHLREDFTFPFVIILSSLILLVAAGCLNAALWKARSRWTVALIAAIYATFPPFASGFSFQFMGDIYAIACLLAVLSVYCCTLGKPRFFFLGILFLVCSMALYQAFLPLVILLFLFTLLFNFVSGDPGGLTRSLRRMIKTALIFLLFGILSGIVYVYSVKLSTALHPGEQLYSYRGMDKIGSLNLSDPVFLIKKAYQAFDSFMLGYYFRIPPYVHFSMVSIGALSLLALLAAAWRSFRSPFSTIAAGALILLFIYIVPPCVFITGLLVSANQIDILQTFGIISVLAAAAFVLLETPLKLIRSISFLFLLVVVLGFVNRSNAITLKGYLWTQASFMTANRVLARIETLPEFNKKSRIALVGKLPSTVCPGTGAAPFNETSRYWRGGPTGFADSRTINTSQKFANILGTFDYKLNPVRPDECLTAEDQAAAMPVWPAAGSVKAFGDLIVVNLSDRYIKNVTLEKTGKNTIRFVIHPTKNQEGLLFGWRISKEGMLIKNIPHSKSNILDYVFDRDGTYNVAAVVRCGETEVITTSPNLVIKHTQSDGDFKYENMPKSWRIE